MKLVDRLKQMGLVDEDEHLKSGHVTLCFLIGNLMTSIQEDHYDTALNLIDQANQYLDNLVLDNSQV